MATGQVLFQRFYHTKSFINHNMEVNDTINLMLINLNSISFHHFIILNMNKCMLNTIKS